jgi:hypothetical protein
MMRFTLIIPAISLCLASTLLAEPRALVDTDFGAANRLVPIPPADAAQGVTGTLPADWRDNSGWAKVQVDYRWMEEQGLGFLRVRVAKVEDGNVQFWHAMPNVSGNGYLRLSFRGRSATRGSVVIGIRHQSAPYEFLWEVAPTLGSNWRDCQYDFQIAHNSQPAGLFILVHDAGEVDLAGIRLVERSRQDVIEEMKSASATQAGDLAAQPRNLVRLSRFPLGLQSGWSLDRENCDGDDVKIDGDPATIGPGGAPAMRLQGDANFSVYTAPFGVPRRLEPHTASLFVKGQARVRIEVVADLRPVAGQNFSVDSDADWKRVELRFNPALMARYHALRLSATGKFWLDGLQVEAGEKASPYASPARCEVALGLPASEMAAARIQFVDEKPSVTCAVTGRIQEGDTLCAKVVDLYNRERLIPKVNLTEGADRTVLVTYLGADAKPLGQFRIEAWIEDAAGHRASTFNECVVTRLLRPRYWGRDAPDSPFGVHTLSVNRHLLMAKAAGVNWVRLHDAGLSYFGWAFLERSPGQWTFHDREINRYRQHHLKILAELGTAPQWASHYPGKAHNDYFDRFYQPRKLEDYANYVKVVTQRYKGVIDAFDVWNEPWNVGWWAVAYDDGKAGAGEYVTSKDPTGDFARLIQTAYQSAKAVDPTVTVVGFNTCAGGAGTTWTRGVLDAGGAQFTDVFCYHHYTGSLNGGPDDSVASGHRQAFGPIIDRLGQVPKPVWMTEGNATGDRMNAGFYRHTLPYQDEEDVVDTSDRLGRYVVALLSQNVRKVFLYSMHGHGYFGPPAPWRALVTDEGYPHPSLAAHSALAWQLEDTRFVKTINLAAGITGYLFEAKDGQRSVAVLLPMAGHAPYTPPTALPGVGNPDVRATDLFGNTWPAGQPLNHALAYVSVAGKDSIAVLETVLAMRVSSVWRSMTPTMRTGP